MDASIYGYYKPNKLQLLLIKIARNAPILKTLFRTRINKVLLRIRLGPIDYELFGLNYRFYTFDNLADRKALLTPNRYDKYEREYLASETLKDGIFFDIGSNVGIYSLFVGSKRKDIKVYAFEPIKKVADRLIYNISINEIKNIKVNNLALSDTCGTVNFSFKSESIVLGKPEAQLPCITLPNFMNQINIKKIDSLKIDVEGAEDKILKPFFLHFKRNSWPKIIVIEHLFPDLWNWNCLEELPKLGYRSIWQGTMNTIFTLD